MKVFIYEDNFELGHGTYACVDGYKLVEHKGHKHIEAIQDENGRIHGYIHEISCDDLKMMDIFYGVGVLHKRLTTTAKLAGGAEIPVELYEFIHAELV
jgi:hypothetical protein